MFNQFLCCAHSDSPRRAVLSLLSLRIHRTFSFFICYLLFASTFSILRAEQELLPPDTPIDTVVDHYIDVQLQKANVTPSDQVTDANLLRRLMFDLCGRLPSFSEVEAYASCSDSQKRVQLVDRLVNSVGFERHQIDELDSLLMYPDRGNLREYLKKSLAEDRRWNHIYRDLMLAEQGSDANNGPSAFLRARLSDIDKMTNEVSVRFFGVNISCAQCHDHPLVSDWTQDHYYGMKSFFARTFENGGYIAEREYGLVDYSTTKGEQRRAKLMFLSGDVVAEPEYVEPSDKDKQAENKKFEELRSAKQPPPPPTYSRRARIIEAGLSPAGQYWMARSIANRIWYRLFGYGLVMPVDQMHSENPPSHPELLEWLARDLIEHEFDLKRLISGLVMSNTYSRDSSWSGTGDRPADNLFAVGPVKMLTPYQFGAALKVATLDPESISSQVSSSDRDKRLENAAGAGRGLNSHFEMPREELQVSVSEALFLSNNKQLIQDLLGGGLVNRLSQIADDESLVDLAVKSVLLRAPTEDEQAVMLEYMATRSDRRQQACQQLVWSLLTNTEFRFNY
jgi:hypothetical protein